MRIETQGIKNKVFKTQGPEVYLTLNFCLRWPIIANKSLLLIRERLSALTSVSLLIYHYSRRH
jgi:hypothetical protein